MRLVFGYSDSSGGGPPYTRRFLRQRTESAWNEKVGTDGDFVFSVGPAKALLLRSKSALHSVLAFSALHAGDFLFPFPFVRIICLIPS
jgi:hypothetical protein